MKKDIKFCDNFNEVVSGNHFFIDKSMFIKEFIDSHTKVTLISRPRGFGKTTIMTMLKAYFEKSEQSNKALFEDLEIWQQGVEYRNEQGKYPVIFLSFKDAKADNWADCLNLIKNAISNEYKRHEYLLDGLHEYDVNRFKRIVSKEASKVDYTFSLEGLSRFLEQYHGNKVYVFIDDPLANNIHRIQRTGYCNVCLFVGQAQHPR